MLELIPDELRRCSGGRGRLRPGTGVGGRAWIDWMRGRRHPRTWSSSTWDLGVVCGRKEGGESQVSEGEIKVEIEREAKREGRPIRLLLRRWICQRERLRKRERERRPVQGF